MMVAKRAWACASVLVVMVSVGCAMPSQQELRAAGDARAQAAQLLDTFALAVRQDNEDLVASLLSRSLSPGEAGALLNRVRRVSWLKRYTGYRVDSARAVRRVGWRQWVLGRARVEASCTNLAGERFTDVFGFVRDGEQWAICDVELNGPVPGDELDLPQDVMVELRPTLEGFLDNLRNGRIADVMYDLPKESLLREPKTSFWDRLWGNVPDGPVNIYADLETMQNFSFSQWPEADKPHVVLYVPPGGIDVRYLVPYAWPAGGVEETDMLHVDIIFMKDGGRWTVRSLRLSGKGIPFS